jgi:hypothetical protein
VTVEIHRIEPRPTRSGAGIRKTKARRERGGKNPRRFPAVIEEQDPEDPEEIKEKRPTPPNGLDRSVSPPTEEDGGMHVDLVG